MYSSTNATGTKRFGARFGKRNKQCARNIAIPKSHPREAVDAVEISQLPKAFTPRMLEPVEMKQA
jgi:hypothetical protein